MKIDPRRFAELTFALAALGACQSAPPAAAPQKPAQRGEPEATESGSAAPASSIADDRVVGPPQGVQGDSSARPEEAPANLAICQKLSPACEGMIGECMSLSTMSDPSGEGGPGQGFRPRVAEEIAACWSSNVKPPKCRTSGLASCIRQAVLRVSIEPTVEARCDAIRSQCQQAGRKPTWSNDQCTHILSAMMPGYSRDEAERMLGPMGEHCTMEFALPYQPFGK
jgi:hypothetical protein